MTVRLVALDIDGTLLDPGVHHDALPTEVMTAAVRRLIDSGVVVTLASGRMFPGTATVARHLGIDRPLICQQGASVHEPHGALRHHSSIDHEIAVELFEFAESAGWPVAWFDSERYLVTEHHEAAQAFADVSKVAIEICPEPHLSGVSATGIDIISTREDAAEVHRQLDQRYGDRLNLLDFPSVTAVHSSQASKGNSLATMARELGIERSEVLAIGDSVNDVSMLAWAGHSAAPLHCDGYARQAADEILTGSGVTGVIAKLTAIL